MKSGLWFSEKKTQISNFMKICPGEAELFRADRRTDMTKITVAFQNFAKAPKKVCVAQYQTYSGRVYFGELSLR